jgi:peptidoglycan/LPS O-acetylase OafA/YrhL
LAETARVPSSTRTGGYRGHIAELDAIRAIGIGIVLINHFWPPSLSSFVFGIGQMGWIAMDAFFVLSGFLITGILVDSRSRPDYFRGYYTRRALRIFPLYYLVLLALFIMTHVSKAGGGTEYAQMVHDWGSPAWFAFYLGNFKMAYVGAFPPVSAYGPLWTLQIEEQFYLFFPLVLRWMRVDHLTRLLWLMVFLSPAFRILLYLWTPRTYALQFTLLPCHMEGLALGSLIAIRFRSGPWQIPKTGLAAVTIAPLLVVCIATTMTLRPEPTAGAFNLFIHLLGISLSSWGCAGLVLWLIVFRESPYTLAFRIAPVQYVAKISYGLYLLHQLVFRGLRWTGRFGIHLAPNGFPRFALLVITSLAMASASWYLLESPLLGLKDRLAPRCTADRVPVGA